MAKVLSKNQKITVYAIFSAVIILLSFLPIKTLGLEITLTMVPIAVGAICFGSGAGLIFGTVFGVVSFLQCVTGYSPFGAMLLGINPFFTFLMCVPTRMLTGFLTGVIYKGIDRILPKISKMISSLLCPLLNTLFFMGTLTALFYNEKEIADIATSLGAVNPVSFIILFVGINGLVELICGFVAAYPASTALSKYLKIKE